VPTIQQTSAPKAGVPTIQQTSAPKERHLRIPRHFRFCFHQRLKNLCVRVCVMPCLWYAGHALELLECVKGGDEKLQQQHIGN
jgi:hypothetical protein